MQDVRVRGIANNFLNDFSAMSGKNWIEEWRITTGEVTHKPSRSLTKDAG